MTGTTGSGSTPDPIVCDTSEEELHKRYIESLGDQKYHTFDFEVSTGQEGYLITVLFIGDVLLIIMLIVYLGKPYVL